MEFLKLTFEWKLVIAFEQIKVRFGYKARTQKSDLKHPACPTGCGHRSPQGTGAQAQGTRPGPAPRRAAQRSRWYRVPSALAARGAGALGS